MVASDEKIPSKLKLSYGVLYLFVPCFIAAVWANAPWYAYLLLAGAFVGKMLCILYRKFEN